MANEYYQFARESSGINDLKRGEEYYQHAIKRYTTTTMTADEIHELGLNEVARIKGEMKQVMKEVGFEGDLKAFFEYVRNKKELMPFTEADEVITNFYSIQEKMLPQVNKLFLSLIHI